MSKYIDTKLLKIRISYRDNNRFSIMYLGKNMLEEDWFLISFFRLRINIFFGASK